METWLQRLQRKAADLRDSLRQHMAECNDGPYADSGDQATMDECRWPLEAVERQLSAQLAAAEKAKGKCQKCGRDIEAERLEILPLTTLCVACATAGPTCEVCGNPIESSVLAACANARKCQACSETSAEVLRRLYADIIWKSKRRKQQAKKRKAKQA